MKLTEIMNNFRTLRVGSVRYWFSYETLIAFQEDDCEVIVLNNYWGKTTGKHINYVKNNTTHIQVNQGEFNSLLDELDI